uniref:Ras-GEF domain-containing protein n=1 Tax=Astyanax mexicanus TaxID=7994 RepID=A0A3B1JSH4_ASTMX
MDPQPEGRVLLVALVEQEEDEGEDEGSDSSSSELKTLPTFDVPYFRYIDDEGTEEEEWCSSRSLSSIDEENSSDSSSVSRRYSAFPATPQNVLEHILNLLKETEGNQMKCLLKTLLDDFLLTYPMFMTTSDLCQRGQGKEEGAEALDRKQKVLRLLSPLDVLLMTVFVVCTVRTDVFGKIIAFDYDNTVLTVNVAPVFVCACVSSVLCRMYVTGDSYVSVRTHSAVTVQELLAAVAERLEWVEEDMVLVALTYTRVLWCICVNSMQQPVVRMLGMNTWDMAVALTNCDWSLFSNLQEKELVYFTLSRDSCAGHTVALELLLQRCNEVQQWVMTEVLLCPALCKRVQLLKKFIKIAAHCKAQRNLNSFFAIIMGLNTAAISRLSQTWEKVPGKFKKLFSELESLTDPSFNHKAYRDAFKKMKSPKIPFLPLLLKDITFIHEGNKTFLDKLVNFEKLHMIADMVRIIRQCQDSPEVKGYINYLYIIDNQQTLFELSHRLEPKV